MVCGVRKLFGANVDATDLRGGAALVVAALGTDGESIIEGVNYIERGYEDLDKMITTLGGDIIKMRE